MIVVTIKMIVKQHVPVYKLVLHVATNKHSPEGTLLPGYTKFLSVKLVR